MKTNLISKSLLLAGFALLLTACSEDNNTIDNSIQLPEGTPTSLTTGYEQGEFSLPINATGKWAATVQPEDAYWLSLFNSEGKGSGTISYLIEPNTSYAYRQASIVITTEGGEQITFPVTQTDMSSSGEDEQINDDGDIDYSKFGTTTPIGYGMYIKKSSNMTRFNAGQIFNVAKLKDAKLKDYLYDGDDPYDKYVTAEDLPTDKVQIKTNKELKNADQSIRANLSVNIQYGMFKLGLKGAFNLYGGTTDTTFAYNAVSTIDSRLVSLNYNSLKEDYNEVPEDLQKLVITSSFAKLRAEIDTLVAHGKTYQDADLRQKLAKLNSTYGPVFCNEARQGGSANISVSNIKSENQDTLAISGTLSATFSSLFSLNVEASANYLNTANSHISGATVDVDITGGDKAARSNLMKGLAQIAKPNNVNIESELIDAISTWSATINPADSKTYTCTTYSLIGIWTLFSDEAAKEVKHYLYDAYPNNTGGYSPYLVDIQAMVMEDGGF